MPGFRAVKQVRCRRRHRREWPKSLRGSGRDIATFRSQSAAGAIDPRRNYRPSWGTQTKGRGQHETVFVRSVTVADRLVAACFCPVRGPPGHPGTAAGVPARRGPILPRHSGRLRDRELPAGEHAAVVSRLPPRLRPLNLRNSRSAAYRRGEPVRSPSISQARPSTRVRLHLSRNRRGGAGRARQCP